MGRLAALEATEITTKVSGALGRPDLASRLEHTRDRLSDPAFTMLVVGEFKQGKSSLINALLAIDVCPVDDDVATAVPTIIRHAEQWSAQVLVEPEGGGAPVHEPIPFDQVRQFVTDLQESDHARHVHSVEIGVPSALLAAGLVIVDTPGVGGLGSAHSAITLAALPMADAVLFVSDASQEYSGPELDFLQTARRLCPHVFGVLTKCDFYPSWRKIQSLDAGHLADIEIDMLVLPVSSELRRLAIANQDTTLNTESGYPALETHLRDAIVARSEQLIL
ncbi:MAG: dynamin family protein, partial [Nocardioidaceae bacterium]